MPIRPFIDGDYFAPELIEVMGQALADACELLGLKDKDDALVRLLASRIIEQARDGVRERGVLKAAAVRGRGH